MTTLSALFGWLRLWSHQAMYRVPRQIVLLLVLLALPAAAAARPMTKWDKDHGLPALLGPFHLSSSRTPPRGDDNGEVVLHVADSQGRGTDVKVEIAYDDVLATLGLGKIDPESQQPQLLLASYSGGAHCCTHIQVVDLVGGQWRTVDVGNFEGEPMAVFPTDIDGDGVVDIERRDDRFAYAFGCYACSWRPPRVFNVRGGKLEDVSAAPRYRALYLKDYGAARKLCSKHVNAACAGLVADGYRLGRATEAWAFAMARIDRKDSWALPGCKVKAPADQCPKGQEFGRGEFRAALTQFLTGDYIKPQP